MLESKLSFLLGNKKALVVVLVFCLFFGAILYLIVRPPTQNTEFPTETTRPTPPKEELTPTPTYTPNEEVLKKLPIVTDNYTVEYLPVPQKFMIIILKNPYEKYKTEIEGWFKDQGINPSDSHLFWGSAKGVAPKP